MEELVTFDSVRARIRQARVWFGFGCFLAVFCVFYNTAPAAARTPVGLDGTPDLFQRVITLPGARLYNDASLQARVVQPQLPVFAIYYVYDRKVVDDESWVEVGQTVNSPEGWIPAKLTQDWTIMLVMQYLPRGQRSRVLFFDTFERLQELVQSPRVVPEAKRLIQSAETGDTAGTGLIAIEEEHQTDFSANPYLLPIVEASRDEFLVGAQTVLLRVGSVNADAFAPDFPERSEPPPDAISKARRGIVFVIDTTSSMGPYIEKAFETVNAIYEQVGKQGYLDRTSFGLVGYRNNMDGRPGLKYVTEVFQPLDPNAPPETLLASLRQMSAATVSTHSWDEDAIAGLYEAINAMNWEPFDEARFIFLITDAGALRGMDPKARHRGVDIVNIREMAAREDIVIFPIHLLTPQARNAGNIAGARRQYMELGTTGDPNVNKYTAIPAGSVAAFKHAMDDMGSELAKAVTAASKGIAQDQPTLDSTPDGYNLGSLFVNELYGAQQRYLGAVGGAKTPPFYSAWASDKDLTDPERTTLGVSVFLTRNQLNALAQDLDRLIERTEKALIDSNSFFNWLRALAATTAVDPQRPADATFVETGLLPAYLTLLPYQTDALRMTEETWRGLDPTRQNQFIDDLRYKRWAYQDLNEDVRNWKDLGAGTPGLMVYPVPLDLLP